MKNNYASLATMSVLDYVKKYLCPKNAVYLYKTWKKYFGRNIGENI